MGGVGGVTIAASLRPAGGGVIGGDCHCQQSTQMGAAVAAGTIAMRKVSGKGGSVARAMQRPILGSSTKSRRQKSAA